jgi:DNA-directed RNA polymerase specialized sigma24 family protein
LPGEVLTLKDILPDIKNDPEHAFESRDLYRRTIGLIDRLPDRDQVLVVATEMEGVTFSELSEKWGIPIGTLLSRKARVMVKLREKIKKFQNSS